jgi:hypothetical protein
VSYTEKQPEPVKVEVSTTVRTVTVVSGKWIFIREGREVKQEPPTSI